MKNIFFAILSCLILISCSGNKKVTQKPDPEKAVSSQINDMTNNVSRTSGIKGPTV